MAYPTKVLTSPLSAFASLTNVFTCPTNVLTSPISAFASPTNVFTRPINTFASPTNVFTRPTNVLTSPTKVFASPLLLKTLTKYPNSNASVNPFYLINIFFMRHLNEAINNISIKKQIQDHN